MKEYRRYMTTFFIGVWEFAKQLNFYNSTLIKKEPKRLPIMRSSGYLKSGHRRATFRCRSLWLVFGVLFFSTAWTNAPAAEVTDLSIFINNFHGHLLLSLKTRYSLKKEAEAPATEEVSSTIVFSIALYQVNKFWFDNKIAHQIVTNTLKYDPLKKEYRLMRSWNSDSPMVVEDLDQAGKLMSEVSNLKVVPLARLEKHKNYQIRVQAVCQDENAFFFGSSGCYKTDLYTVDFTF